MSSTYFAYEQETLRKLQRVELEMLQEFDRVCQKYGIEYFALFGAAIGAIRHHGFIPWDDDVDVGMTREEFEKLRAVPENEWRDDLRLVAPEDADAPFHRSVWPKLYKMNSVYEQSEFHRKYRLREKNCKSPIWMDIFIFDRVANLETVKKCERKIFSLGRLYFYLKCHIKAPHDAPFAFKVRCWLKEIMHRVAHLVPRPELWAYRKFRREIAKHSGEMLTVYATIVPEETIALCDSPEKMFPCVRVPFEDGTIPLQKNYDEALRRLYGDYMQLPPEEKRFNHPPLELDLGDGNGYVVSSDRQPKSARKESEGQAQDD